MNKNESSLDQQIQACTCNLNSACIDPTNLAGSAAVRIPLRVNEKIAAYLIRSIALQCCDAGLSHLVFGGNHISTALGLGVQLQPPDSLLQQTMEAVLSHRQLS